MKKTHVKLILMLVLMICIFVLPQCVNAATYKDDAGNTYTYSISNNEATITDFSGGGDAVIPETLEGYPVTSIGRSVFSYCTSLKSITIPDSVTSIGKWAFRDCASLTSITILGGVTSIGEDAFDDCTSLAGVYITDLASWCNIDFSNLLSNPLYYAENLYINGELASDIVIPNEVETIKPYAFRDCTSLTSVTILDSVTSIGSSAFNSCTSLTEITIPNSVTSIGTYAFHSCTSLTNVTMSESITSIGEWAFSYCTSLKSITIPDSVTSIGGEAFRECASLASIAIPESVTSIGGSAFSGCTNINTITYNTNTITSYSTSNHPFSDCGASSGLKVIIGECVEIIPDYFLYNNTNIVDITFGKSVKTIGLSAFYGCTGLKELIMPDNITNINNSAFYGCSNIESIVMSNSVTTIEPSAFYNCSNLTRITIPESVTSIGIDAFSGCTNISTINYNANAITSLSDYDHPFSDCGASSGLKVIIGECVEIIPDYFLYNNTNVVDITFGKSVKTIGLSAFYGCTGLKELMMPDNITNINNSAFYGCSNIESIVMSNSVTTIEPSAFYNCSNLTRITIPDSVMSIGEGAFEGCQSLEEITLPFIGSKRGNSGTVDSVFGYIFGYVTGYSNKVTDTKQNYSSGSYAYYHIPTSLTQVTVTDETMIGYGAFYGCSTISDIVIKGDIKGIGSYAFAYHNNFLNVTIESEDVKFGDNYIFRESDFVTLYGYSGSTVENYANKNNIDFEILAGAVDYEIGGTVTALNNTIVVNVDFNKYISGEYLNVVLYGRNNVLLDYIIVPSNKPYNHMNVVFKDNPGASYVKVFLWDSLIQGVPLTTAKRINIDR